MTRIGTAPALTRSICAALLALMMAVRLLAPAGFMPSFEHGAVTIVACPDADAGGAMAAHHDEMTDVERDGYVISTDPARLDRPLIHGFLSRDSYWAQDIPHDVVMHALDHSLCFGLYAPAGQQIGLARVVTDYATVAYPG